MGDKYGFDLSGAILGNWVTVKEGRKEGNCYLWLYGVRHMVKDNSASKRGNLLLPYGLWLAAKVLLYASSHRPLPLLDHGALAVKRNSSTGSPWRIIPMTHRTMRECSYHGAITRSGCKVRTLSLPYLVSWNISILSDFTKCTNNFCLLIFPYLQQQHNTFKTTHFKWKLMWPQSVYLFMSKVTGDVKWTKPHSVLLFYTGSVVQDYLPNLQNGENN